MKGKRLLGPIMTIAVFGLGVWFGRAGLSQRETVASAEAGRVFEMRTYTATEGKLEALHARFRNHTTKLFEKHGITNVGYWTPADAPLSRNTLIYILAHPSREAAKKNWESFRNDPEWKKVKEESEAKGALVVKVESVFVNPTDYSPTK